MRKKIASNVLSPSQTRIYFACVDVTRDNGLFTLRDACARLGFQINAIYPAVKKLIEIGLVRAIGSTERGNAGFRVLPFRLELERPLIGVK